MLDICEINVLKGSTIYVEHEIIREPEVGIRVISIYTSWGLRRDFSNNTKPTNKIVYNEEIRSVFNKIVADLFNDLKFRNSLMYINDNDLDVDDLEIYDEFESQFYYLLFDVIEDFTESDSYFNFGYKIAKCNLKYAKFKVSQSSYYKFRVEDRTDETIKEMYLKSYSDFLDFVMENKDDLDNIEDMVKDVFYKREGNIYKVHDWFREKHMEAKEYIDKWFLLKSDYKSVDIILEGMKKDSIKVKGIRNIINKIFNVYTWFFVLILPIISYFLYMITNNKIFNNINGKLIVFNYTLIITIMLYNHFKFNISNSFDGMIYVITRRYYPRLLGAIIAGYAILLLGDEIYKYIINLEYPKLFIITLLALILSWGYLYSKISNKVEQKNRAIKRSMKVFFTGLCESYSLIYFLNVFVITNFLKGLISNELIFTHVNIDCFKNYMLTSHSILFDSIHHVKITVLFPALALMIGIFIQILWEEGEITKPL